MLIITAMPPGVCRHGRTRRGYTARAETAAALPWGPVSCRTQVFGSAFDAFAQNVTIQTPRPQTPHPQTPDAPIGRRTAYIALHLETTVGKRIPSHDTHGMNATIAAPTSSAEGTARAQDGFRQNIKG